jgi:hypothetical protein
MKLSLLTGLLAGLDARDIESALEPGPERCCVAIKPRGDQSPVHRG